MGRSFFRRPRFLIRGAVKKTGAFEIDRLHLTALDVPPCSVAQGFGVFRHCNDLNG
jgi:hypothetical protein